MLQPRVANAENRGPFTLDGTRTYIVGRRSVAVIDPGPHSKPHLRALRSALAEATDVTVLVTHDHADHSGAARALAHPWMLQSSARAGTPTSLWVRATPCKRTRGCSSLGRHPATRPITWLSTGPPPMRSRRRPLARTRETTWVGEYPGCVHAYLESLDRVERLAPAVVYPAHGPPLRDVSATLRVFREHRRGRIEQVRRLLDERPEASAVDLVRAIYAPGCQKSSTGPPRPACRRWPIIWEEQSTGSAQAATDHRPLTGPTVADRLRMYDRRSYRPKLVSNFSVGVAPPRASGSAPGLSPASKPLIPTPAPPTEGASLRSSPRRWVTEV